MAVFGEQIHEPALINEARRLRYDEFLSIRVISERTGIPRSTLGGYLKGEGESFYEIPCVQCGELMFSLRGMRRYCSPRCQHHWFWAHSAKYRERKRRANRMYKQRKMARMAEA